jgi:hypothetical protein
MCVRQGNTAGEGRDDNHFPGGTWWRDGEIRLVGLDGNLHSISVGGPIAGGWGYGNLPVSTPSSRVETR